MCDRTRKGHARFLAAFWLAVQTRMRALCAPATQPTMRSTRGEDTAVRGSEQSVVCDDGNSLLVRSQSRGLGADDDSRHGACVRSSAPNARVIWQVHHHGRCHGETAGARRMLGSPRAAAECESRACAPGPRRESARHAATCKARDVHTTRSVKNLARGRPALG